MASVLGSMWGERWGCRMEQELASQLGRGSAQELARGKVLVWEPRSGRGSVRRLGQGLGHPLAHVSASLTAQELACA